MHNLNSYFPLHVSLINLKLLDISDWNTSSNTDFYETFSFAESFNGDLNKWDVSNGMNTVFVLGLIYEMINLSMSNPSLSAHLSFIK